MLVNEVVWSSGLVFDLLPFLPELLIYFLSQITEYKINSRNSGQ